MQHQLRGADIVWNALKKGGVTRVFSLSGNHIMEVYDAAFGDNIGIVHVRHEAAAVHMAEAWARLTGEVGVALVTGGQGHTNACAALPTAMAGEAPVLLLSGHAPTSELGMGAFQETPQVEMAAPLTKAAWLAHRADELAADIAKGMRIARSGRPGPVHISLPTDVLEAQAAPTMPDEGAFLAAPMPLSAEAAAAVLSAIHKAERPLIVCGSALNTPEGAKARAALAKGLNLPIAIMESPRGLNDPSLGDFAGALQKADLVVLLGKPLDFTLRFGKAAPNARFVAIEPDGAIINRAVKALGERLVLTTPAAPLAAAETLAGLATPHRNAEWGEWARTALLHRPEEWGQFRNRPGGPIHPATLGYALQEHLIGETALMLDGGEIGQWMQAILQGDERITNGVAGAIGAVTCFAIAARAARPNARILACMGDGTFGFHMAEFDTAVRHNLPFVCVVGNDGKWNAEYQIQKRDYGADRAHGCELASATRYDLVASALGGHGEFVTRFEELHPALERAFASNRPAVVNVVIEGLPAPNLKRA
jgi:acetolactate synthase-1/2/3 large subunit